MPITYLTGPAGTGKTTRAVAHLRRLLADHVPGHNILVLTPQATLAGPYRDLLRDPELPGAAAVDILTLSGLTLRTIDLFWPLVAAPAGFGRPRSRPIFLTIETAQYYLRQVIEPLLRQGYFDPNVVPITISLPRLMSQILDNLNKAALIGLPHTEVGTRLAASLAIEPSSRAALEHTQVCVNEFRAFCLARNLLDFSLRIDTFQRHLWPVEGIRRYLTERYHHLIVDNIEEDNPFAHTLLREWLPQTESALLINDEDAGYRIFLGANWRTAQSLANLADETMRLTDSHVAPPDMLALGEQLGQILQPPTADRRPPTTDRKNRKSKIVNRKSPDPRRVITFQQERFYPQMIEWVIDRIAGLLAEGISPEQIVVLAPFVSDALRFSFTQRMAQHGLPARSHRPSRPLSEEPAAKTVLTLARLAFPEMGLLPEPFDVAHALNQAIADLDLIRANLLTQVVYRRIGTGNRGPGTTNLQSPISNLPLSSFDQIEGDVRERISYQAGQRFDRLRGWLQTVRDSGDPPVLDHFLSRLFGELLSQPGFGFHHQPEAGHIVANLIDSARQFRRVVELVPSTPAFQPSNLPTSHLPTPIDLNRAYLETIEQGIMAAQYLRSWEAASGDLSGTSSDNAANSDTSGAVLITPATTFLVSNRPVDYQFWLDAGSSGWWERIAQPLTHPYVLTADWEAGRPWTDADEVAGQRDRLYRLVLGLTRRCRKHIFIVNSEVGEQGYEQRGQLLVALQQMLRQMQTVERK
ncbi:MAG: AAA family ATPase [Anaerolineae bacterium]|nr:AAA family ATPase [Anaerolineae bacterium]